ncbi:hypothetical protein D9613_009666 [Agrocybe pediades]|uniref:Uncharacterized protein n=1 Tax=Agrocybe pediades TaxID=84607 RepID=A0A8H4QXL7_9AGAR|nr:hypothetical protein D9613_009666 [Agrocybe pediades]
MTDNHHNAGMDVGMDDDHHNARGNYTTTSRTAFSMISGTNILITGRPEFKTINGEWNVYENTTHTTNVNSNNVIGNSLTDTFYDNSQVIYVEGRGRARRQVRRERRYGENEATVNEGHQANAFPPPTSFATQFPPSGLPNSTTWSSGYVQTFPPPFAAPFSNFTHSEGGIVSTTSFDVAPGDVEGMGEQSSQLFLKLFGALEAEHFVQAESSTTIPPALAPATSYGSDNSTQSTTYIDLTSGSSYSSPLADNRTAPIEAGMANLSIDEPVQAPFFGQHTVQPDYRSPPVEARMAELSLNDPVQTNNAMSPVVAGMANLSLNQQAQSNYALPADGVSAMFKSTILSAASMPDNLNMQTSSGRPRIDTSSSTHLYGPPATSFSSTLFDSPVCQSPSAHPFQPAQRQTVPTPYRQTIVSEMGGVQIAPGAHVTSMTFNGSYTEVNNRQTTVNHGMSGMVVGNTVTHVRNVVGKESMMQQPGDVKEGTRKQTMGKQGHIHAKKKKWSN